MDVRRILIGCCAKIFYTFLANCDSSRPLFQNRDGYKKGGIEVGLSFDTELDLYITARAISEPFLKLAILRAVFTATT